MKEDIMCLFTEAVCDDTSPSIFAEQIMDMINKMNLELLNDVMNQQEEIINSPIRFNGVHVERIKQIFESRGIKFDIGF